MINLKKMFLSRKQKEKIDFLNQRKNMIINTALNSFSFYFKFTKCVHEKNYINLNFELDEVLIDVLIYFDDKIINIKPFYFDKNKDKFYLFSREFYSVELFDLTELENYFNLLTQKIFDNQEVMKAYQENEKNKIKEKLNFEQKILKLKELNILNEFGQIQMNISDEIFNYLLSCNKQELQEEVAFNEELVDYTNIRRCLFRL